MNLTKEEILKLLKELGINSGEELKEKLSKLEFDIGIFTEV